MALTAEVLEKVEQGPARGPRLRRVPAVSRAIAILRLLGRTAEPMGVKAIAKALGLVPSTCLHILRVLVDEELVRVDAATKRYSLGVGMLALARSVIEGTSFAGMAQPVLDRLSTKWGVTALGVEVSGLKHMVVVALSRSHIPFRLHVDVGSRFPALISATGRLVAAYNGHPWREIEARFRELRWQNPPELATWRKEVEAVATQGYAADFGNYINGVTVLSVPLRNARGHATQALVVTGLADQLGGRLEELAAEMRLEADRLNELLPARS